MGSNSRPLASIEADLIAATDPARHAELRAELAAAGLPNLAAELGRIAAEPPRVPVQALDRGQRFTGPDGTTLFEVVTPASEHPRGWVDVRDLSMTDEEAAALVATPGAVERGSDPRRGFFAYSHPTYVNLAPDATNQP